MEKKRLLVLDLDSIESRNSYNAYRKAIDAKNPFFKLDLVSLDSNAQNKLYCFVYLLNGQPKILMPMYLHKIEGHAGKTSFYDACSPYGYSGPLILDSLQSSYIEDFWRYLDEWYLNNNVITEFVRFSLNSNYKYFSGRIIPTLQGVRGRVRETEDEQFNHFRSKVRRNYRKAITFGLDFKVFHNDIGEKEITEFCGIYKHTLDRNKARKRYYFSRENFSDYITNNPEACALAMVYYKNTAISAEFVLLSNDRIYTFLGGTISDYFYTRPNDFLKVEMLKWARLNHYSYWYLGGGMAMKDSLYRYKKTFFPKDEDVFWYTGRKIVNKEAYIAISEKAGIRYTEDSILRDKYFPAYRNPSLTPGLS